MSVHSGRGSHSQVKQYKLQEMQMHQNGKKISMREEDGIIEDSNQNYGGYGDYDDQFEYNEREKKDKKRKSKKEHGKKDLNKVTIQTYNPSDGPWWQAIFPCCSSTTVVEPEYEDCGQCGRRVYADSSDSSDEEPYISRQRMQQREKQSINVFYDRIKNNELIKTSWQ